MKKLTLLALLALALPAHAAWTVTTDGNTPEVSDGHWTIKLNNKKSAVFVSTDGATNVLDMSTLNADRLDALYDRAVELGASKLDLFFLVPVGRGKGIADYALSDAQTRQVLDWAFAKAKAGPLAVKETCCPSAPVYWTACGGEAACGPRPCGCLGGRGFAFLSHVGDLQTCGFIDVPCGNIRDFNCDFRALAAAAANPLGAHGTCRNKVAKQV